MLLTWMSIFYIVVVLLTGALVFYRMKVKVDKVVSTCVCVFVPYARHVALITAVLLLLSGLLE